MGVVGAMFSVPFAFRVIYAEGVLHLAETSWKLLLSPAAARSNEATAEGRSLAGDPRRCEFRCAVREVLAGSARPHVRPF